MIGYSFWLLSFDWCISMLFIECCCHTVMTKKWGFLPSNHKLTPHPFFFFFSFFSLTSRTHLIFFFFFFLLLLPHLSGDGTPTTTDPAVTHYFQPNHFQRLSSFPVKPNRKTPKNSNPISKIDSNASKIDFNATKFVFNASKLNIKGKINPFWDFIILKKKKKKKNQTHLFGKTRPTVGLGGWPWVAHGSSFFLLNHFFFSVKWQKEGRRKKKKWKEEEEKRKKMCFRM